MDIITEVNNITVKDGSALTFGNFDGVHLGHQALIKDMVQRTKEMLMRRFSRKSTIVTGPMGLMSPTPVAYAGAFGITDGATGDQIIQQGAEQGFVPLDSIQKDVDDYLENLIFESQEV